ncbi:MAG: hypothetical protein COU40_01990 [Candidatus Moranbacteria bacterium CG10_big_fil_rev_8_21_14_0_10_35_21]|nr:MAG: hypothetical protein COU40_01990 [Candidatus Moranbacteria bacterium CG10_big_fil_rev_8_21_14_0_10_35_21]PJA88868.1 MAG: hypothetical protein CO139_00855 [Candidatus Moranbacteria bacterium CG_4_9_14_3_um_filter_36_9]
MLTFIQSQVLFYLAIILVLFLPGYFLLLAIFGKKGGLEKIEKFILSPALSLVVVDFIFFVYSRLQISITRSSSIFGIVLVSAIFLIIFKLRKFSESKEEKIFDFSSRQFWLVAVLLFLTFFIKTAYLTQTILPTATDMGHHMYWAKWMAESGQLPTYEGMPDFIIGEHIVFGIVNLISGASFFSAFPTVILHLINLMGILAVFLLVLRIFKNKNTAILSLLFLGVLYAVASPQSKFVSGGVIGNIFGNFLMPVALYFYFRAFDFFQNESLTLSLARKFLALAVFITFGLFYTHHLTAFIFIFVFIFTILIFLAVNLKNLKEIFVKIRKLVFSPPVLSALAIGLIFFLLVFTPNYIKNNSVETAVGTPEKITRTGLSLNNLKSAVGEPRLALGLFALLLMVLNFKKKNVGYAILVAWFLAIFLMATRPQWLLLDLPSNRIGNYLSYPLAILSAYSFFIIFSQFKNYVSGTLAKLTFVIILTFVLVGGLYDSAAAFKRKVETAELIQTFNATEYLAKNTTPTDNVLKDHNYITGDAWMKLFFMRGYRYPLSRSFFKRYEDSTNPREQCTLLMISSPESEKGQKCFQETGVNFLAVNPAFDSDQFKRSRNFDLLYLSPEVAIFNKTN